MKKLIQNVKCFFGFHEKDYHVYNTLYKTIGTICLHCETEYEIKHEHDRRS